MSGAMNTDYLVAEIDLGALAHNCRVVRSLARPACRLCVPVKANAYGHGVEVVLPGLRAAKVDMLAVVSVREAAELRGLGWERPVLLMGTELGAYEGGGKDEIAGWLVEHGISVTASSAGDLDALARAAERVGKPAAVHLMLDSGMSREGLHEPEVLELVGLARENPAIWIEGLYTHFATADDGDKSFANAQLQRFAAFVAALAERGIRVPIVHAANSPASIDLPESHFNMIRPGVSVYGCHSSPQMRCKPDLRQVLRLVSRLTLVKRIGEGCHVGYGCTFTAPRDMLIGLAPIGYADGYPRSLSNCGRMLVGDRPAPVIGRVSMDQTILDLSDLEREGVRPAVGQEVVIIDNRPGSPNTIEAICEQVGTIPQAVMTGLGRRVRRVAVNA